MSTDVPIQALIRGNNAVWYLMYYDELVDTPSWQLTFLREADAGFYNCAHAVTRLNDADQECIEAFFMDRGVAPAFYVDPESSAWLPERLQQHGYVEVDEEAEHWWVVELTQDRSERWRQSCYHKLAPGEVAIELVAPDDSASFEAFLRVDQRANQLPDNIMAKLRRNILTHTWPGARNHYFLGRVRGEPVCSGSVGFWSGMAFLAEGGTLPDHRGAGLHTEMIRQRALFAHQHGARWLAFTCTRTALSNRTGSRLEFELAFVRHYFRKTGDEDQARRSGQSASAAGRRVGRQPRGNVSLKSWSPGARP